MNENHRKVLELLAQGKVSVAEAEQLLEKLKTPEPTAKEDEKDADAEDSEVEAPRAKGSKKIKPKFLRVQVHTEDDEKFNLRLPLPWVRTGVNLGAFLPKHARRALEAQGVDISKLSDLEGTAFDEALEDMGLDLDDEDGNKVRIFWE